MRIAVVTETFPPEVNGVAATAARFAEGLADRGHSIEVVRPRQRGERDRTSRVFSDEILVRGLPIPRYPNLRLGLPATRFLARRWTTRRPDIVHVITEGPLGCSAIRAARSLGLPVVSDFRTNFHAYSSHYGIGWLEGPIESYLRRFHNATRLTLVPTESLRRHLLARGFENLRVVARGVDSRLFSPQKRSEALRRAWGAESDTPVALHVGRLAPEKNIGAIVDAFEAMVSAVPTTRLVFVGEGPAEVELRRRCPAGIFAGRRSGEDLATHYASADVFLFSSLTETFGNVTPEAMASGLAVVAFDYAAATEFITDGKSGRLCPYGDHRSFIANAASLARDIVSARALGRAARSVAERLDWEQVILQLEEALVGQALAGQVVASSQTGSLAEPVGKGPVAT